MRTMFWASVAALALVAPAAAQEAPAGAMKAPAPAAAVAEAGANVVTVAAADQRFSTLKRALKAADLEATLASASGVTLFAPTDAAFAALPAGELDRLLRPENKAELRTLLQNHVVSGPAKSDYLAGKKGAIESLGGQQLALDGSGGSVKVGGATVIAADIPAGTSVIHAVDRVILPQPQAATASAQPAPAPAPTDPAEGDDNE